MSARGSMLSIWASQRQPWFRPWETVWNVTNNKPVKFNTTVLFTDPRENVRGLVIISVSLMTGLCYAAQQTGASTQSEWFLPPVWSRTATSAGSQQRRDESSQTSSSGNCPDLLLPSRPHGIPESWGSEEKVPDAHLCSLHTKVKQRRSEGPLTSDIPPREFRPSSEDNVGLRRDISCASGRGWGLPPGGAAPRHQRPP